MLQDLGFSLNPFIRSFSTWATLAVLTVMSVVLAAVVPRRQAAVLATGLACAAVGAFTLPPSGGWPAFTVHDDPFRAVVAALQPQPSDLTAWLQNDGPANVALFLPLGFTLALLLRRPIVATLLGSLTSATIEAYQAGTGTRVGSCADVVANSVGAAVGATIGAAVLLTARALGGVIAAARQKRPVAADATQDRRDLSGIRAIPLDTDGDGDTDEGRRRGRAPSDHLTPRSIGPDGLRHHECADRWRRAGLRQR